MATTVRKITVALLPEATARACEDALIRARFTDINACTSIITARRRQLGQWTKGKLTLTISYIGDGSEVVVTAQARAQSLGSLVFSPSKRMVTRFVRELARSGVCV